MKRKDFLKGLGGLAAAGPVSAYAGPDSAARHIVTLSFDDGFRKSFVRTAEIFEKFSLSACFNIIATGHYPDSQVRDDYMKPGQLGDFVLWNELQDRGHEVMPHGHHHAHLDQLPTDQAKGLILECLDIFSSELKGFDPRKAVFNFPYNASTPELKAWLPEVVLAYRCHGDGPLNPLPHPGMVKLGTGGFGPDNSEADLDQELNKLLARPNGWLIYNLHGLDDEGWGPVRAEYLEKLLARLTRIESVRILPAARALHQAEALGG